MEADIVKSLISGIPGGAVAGFLLYIYIGERAERREMQQQQTTLLRSSIEGDGKVADAINGTRQEIVSSRQEIASLRQEISTLRANR